MNSHFPWYAILNSLDTAIVMFDNNMKIYLCNYEMERLAGLSSREMSGKTLLNFFPPADQKRLATFYNQLISGKREPRPQATFTLLNKEGTQKKVLLSISLVSKSNKAVASLTDLTETIKLQKELAMGELKFRYLFENAQEGIYQTTPDGKILLANTAFIQLLGYNSLDEILALNIATDIYLHESERYSILSQLQRCGKYSNLEQVWQKKDGSPIIVRCSGHAIYDARNKLICYENTAVDITELKEAQRTLEVSQKFCLDLVHCLPDPTFAINTHGEIVAWNKAIELLTGHDVEMMIGKGNYEYAMAVLGERRPLLIDYLLDRTINLSSEYSQLRQEGETISAEIYAPLLKGGKGAHIWGSAALIRDIDGKVMGAIETIKDFTDYIETKKKLQYYSMNDILTGLYNRSYFEEEIKRLNHTRFLPLSVIICDVDGLKLINDSLGHMQGDDLLRATANVLRSAFRASDAISRIGGDEFAVILPHTDDHTTQEIIKRINTAVDAYNKDSSEYHLSLTVGYATGNLPLNQLIIEADNNLIRNKMQHSATAKHLFTKSLTSLLAERDFINDGHVQRLIVLAELMADHINLTLTERTDLLNLAKFHDIGKVAIPDKILFKPTTLTPQEMQEIKKHAEIGYRIAKSSPELSHIANYILHHHEWWNGEGYPLGLKEKEIPLLSRILSILDAYDAMSNKRPQRGALSQTEVLNEMTKLSGVQFDPYLLAIFLELIQKEEIIQSLSLDHTDIITSDDLGTISHKSRLN